MLAQGRCVTRKTQSNISKTIMLRLTCINAFVTFQKSYYAQPTEVQTVQMEIKITASCKKYPIEITFFLKVC